MTTEAQAVTPPEKGDEPPKDVPGKSSGAKSPPPAPRVRKKPLEARLVAFFGQWETAKRSGPEPDAVYLTGIAGAVAVFDPYDGSIIAANSENMAAAWAHLAEQNEVVRRYLERMLSGGAWGEVIFATAPVMFAVAMHHKLIPASIFGGPQAEGKNGEPGVHGTGTGDGTSPEGSVGSVPPGVPG